MPLFVVVPLLVLLLVWRPEIAHYRAPSAGITESMIEAAQHNPDDEVLREIGEFYLLPIEGRDGALEVSLAERILEGRLELPEVPAGSVDPPFAPGDLERLPAGLQLWYAGLVVPDLLLAAYDETGREELFAAAQDFISAWDEYERRTLVPPSMLWNDHAVAARVRVLGEFWRIYRSRPDYRPEVGRAVLEQAARYGHFLSSPDHFTFATNHGVMQNLGLLQLSLAFPTLPERERYHRIAMERLSGQLAFYIDEAGVIRENSAEYQAFGLGLLGMTFRSMTLLGDSIPQPWAARYEAGLAFLDTLMRPDGTLPAAGDTDGAPLGAMPSVTDVDASGRSTGLEPFRQRGPDAAESLDAAAGYWVAWEDAGAGASVADASQTVVTWTSPPSTGHKHADEMSVHLWSDDVSWVTAAGYWPYGVEGRSEAESWDGSNAPHVAGESYSSRRTTRLIGHGSGDGVSAVDLARTGPGDYRARRQVVSIDGGIWVVLDSVTGVPDTGNRTVWTFSPDTSLRTSGAPGSYELRSKAGQTAVTIDLLGSNGTEIREYEGSRSPFLGWHVVDATPRAAPAVTVNQPGGSAWLAVVVAPVTGSSPDDQVGGRPDAPVIRSAEDWTLIVHAETGPVEIRRSGGSIVVTRTEGPEDSQATVQLAPGPDVAGEQARVRSAFESMAREYPAYRPLTTRRIAASIAIVFLLAAQEVGLLIVRRTRPRRYLPLRVASLLCWVAAAFWLHGVALRSWETVTLLICSPCLA